MKILQESKKIVNLGAIYKAKSVLRAAGYDVDGLSDPDDVMAAMIEDRLSLVKTEEGMKNIIYNVYDEDRSGYLMKRIERFVTDKGVPETAPDILDGLSYKDVSELYNCLYDWVTDVYEGRMSEALDLFNVQV